MTTKPDADAGEAVTTRFDWLIEHQRPIVAAMVAIVGAALTGLLGPCVVEQVRRPIEQQKVQAQLISKVVDAAGALDPADFRSIVRLGVVADLVRENHDVFSLQVDKAAGRLDALAQELKNGSVGVLSRSIQNNDGRVARWEEVQVGLRAQMAATDAGPVHDALADLAARNQRFIDELKRAQQDDRGALEKLTSRVGQAAAERVDEVKASHRQLVSELTEAVKAGRVADRESRAKLESALEALQRSTGRIADDSQAVITGLKRELEALKGERDALATRTREQDAKAGEQAERFKGLEANLAAARDEAAFQAQVEPDLRKRLAPFGVIVRRGSGGLRIILPDAWPKQGGPRAALTNVLASLRTLGNRRYQIVEHAAERTPSTARAARVLQFLTRRSAWAPAPLERGLLSIAGVVDAPSAGAADGAEPPLASPRVEIVLLPPEAVNLVAVAQREKPAPGTP